jgi:release factor glutamine methyltransferase
MSCESSVSGHQGSLTARQWVTIHARVAMGRARLRHAGIGPEEADLDARLLAQELLGWDAARFFTSSNEPEPADFAARYEPLVARREGREPLAYITGRKEFWGLELEVSPAVLIPRPETELIVEAALERFSQRHAPLEAADICTGSGCLAVALARERPGARFVATDVSADALRTARRNAERHGVAGRVQPLQADVFGTGNGVPALFDLIVSNPPYVPEGDRPTLQPEVRDHEPTIALIAGKDGLAIIKRLVEQSAGRLTPGGLLIFEFGLGQADAVRALISQSPGLTMLEVKGDLQGIPRTAIARRNDFPHIG